jgi:hypothetical protein
MKALRFALVAVALAAAAGCSRSGPAEKPKTVTYDGASTRGYLLLVGQVRSQINSDNRQRIPALICGLDTVMLGNQAARISKLEQSLAGFPTDNVDPDAVQFAQNVGKILEAYQSACLDSAELFREVAHQDEVLEGQKPRIADLKNLMRAPQGDTVTALEALAAAMGKVGDTKKPGFMSSAAMVQKILDDKDKLLSAREVHHLFVLKVKTDFAQRYPTTNWVGKEILP